MTSCSVLVLVCYMVSCSVGASVCYMVSSGEQQCAGGGKFRVIMQYMEPHCIVQELEDGWQGHGVLHRWVGIGGRLGGIWGYAAVCAITGEGGIILGRY